MKLTDFLTSKEIKEHEEFMKKLLKSMNENIEEFIDVFDEKMQNVWYGEKFNVDVPFQLSIKNLKIRETNSGNLINEIYDGIFGIKITINKMGKITKEWLVNKKWIYKISCYPYNPKNMQWYYNWKEK